MSNPVVLPLKTVRNPRDLGGYIGFNGRKIKSHRLLRTGKINGLSKHDEHFLLNYGVKKIIDLRSPAECKKCTDEELPGVEHFDIPVSVEDNTKGGSSNVTATFARYRRDQYAGFRMMCHRYRSHVEKPHAQHSFHKILELLADTKDGAVLYHCSEGKDRTGVVTMLILYILGVDMETIRQDYLYSNYMLNDYRADRDAAFKKSGENIYFRANMRILGSVSDAFLDTALITIDEEFGGLDKYIREELDVTPELRDALRELYLEK